MEENKKEKELTTEEKIQMFIQKINAQRTNLSFVKMNNIEAWEVDGNWTLENITLNSTIMSRHVICEIFVVDEENNKRERTGIYLCQYQKKFYSAKTNDIIYEYSEISKVLPLTGTVINNKWVVVE